MLKHIQAFRVCLICSCSWSVILSTEFVLEFEASSRFVRDLFVFVHTVSLFCTFFSGMVFSLGLVKTFVCFANYYRRHSI